MIIIHLKKNPRTYTECPNLVVSKYKPVVFNNTQMVVNLLKFKIPKIFLKYMAPKWKEVC